MGVIDRKQVISEPMQGDDAHLETSTRRNSR